MVKEKIYPNGLRLIVDKNKRSKIVSTGIMVNIGSNREEPHEYGLAHFLEHIMFKSTTTRNFKDTSKLLDGLGIKYNAMTTKQYTYYYMDCIEEILGDTLEIFADMFFNGLFDKDEIDMEKKVVLEEMNMCEDSPHDILLENLMDNMYHGKINGHRILGDRKVIESATPDTLRAFKDKYYRAENMIVTVVGDVDFDKIESYVDRLFASHFNYKCSPTPRLDIAIEPNIKSKYVAVQKDEKQVNIAIMIKAPRINSRLYDAFNVYARILGYGRSSRLFERVREKDGLCYVIDAYPSSNIIAGNMIVYVAVAQTEVEKVLIDIKEEICGMIDSVTEEELNRAKVSLKTDLVFAYDSNGVMAHSNANELYDFGKIFTMSKETKDIEKVTLTQVNDMAKKIAKESKFVVCAVGNNIDLDVIKRAYK